MATPPPPLSLAAQTSSSSLRPPLPPLSSPHHPRQVWSEARLYRGITILTFVPAFPLLVAHGVLSESLFPAIGLAPLFVSAVVGLFLISRFRARDRRRQKGIARGEYVDDEATAVAANHPPDESAGWEGEDAAADDDDENQESVFTHRIWVFFTDAGLTAGLAVVLGFTWIKTEMSADAVLAMLAAYGTIPLLVNFLIHLYLTVREFAAGLELHGLLQYAAWHVLPPDCPDCGSRLRPEAHPPIPWYESVSRPEISVPSLPALPKAPSLPVFKVPVWMKRKSAEQEASLFVDDDQIQRDRYRDDPEEPPSSTHAIVTGESEPIPVVEEVIVGKKDKKKRSISAESSSAAALYGEDDSSWA